MNVGIVGAGAVAMGYAAHLLSRSHDVSVWSPSGERTQALIEGEALTVMGAIGGHFFPKVCNDAGMSAQSDVVLLALPAYGHRAVMDALLPHLEHRHTVIISGHLSFAALYLSKALASRGVVSVWARRSGLGPRTVG